MQTMKAITISQPFASLIASGEKFVENRSWPTRHRGKTAIHAGKGRQYLTCGELKNYPSGCIIAVARLVACHRVEEIIRAGQYEETRFDIIPGTSYTWTQVKDHVHTEGPYCWIFEDVKEITAVPMRGAQGLWVATFEY